MGRIRKEGKRNVEIREKKTGIRRAIAALALLLLICGCGEAGGQAAGAETARTLGRYEAEFLPLETYCESVSAVKLGNGQKVFFTGMENGEEMLFSLEIGREGVEKYPLGLETGMQVTAIGEDAEGNLLLAVTGYEGDPAAGGTVAYVAIGKASPEGEMLELVDTGETFRGREVASFYIKGLYQDRDGKYYISAVQDVYVLHPDGSVFFQVSAGAYLSAMFVLEDGRVVVGYNGKRGWKLETVELSGKGLEPLESSLSFGNGVYGRGAETDLAYSQEGALYLCNLSDREPVPVLNWRDCNINSDAIRDFAVLPDGRVVTLLVDYSAGGRKELAVLSEAEDSGKAEKTVLTYAALEAPYYVERDIVAFNKENDKYYIQVKEYGDESMDYMDRAALLNADLTGGQAPDMVDVAFSGLSLEQLIAAGVAEDLTPFLERDGDIRREDFVESVIKAYERDGKLYAIMPSFGIETIVGKVADVGEANGWTVDEMMGLLEDKGKDTEILENAGKGTMLWLACLMNQGLFLDMEAGTCDFTGGEFEKILEFANRFPGEPGNVSDAGAQMEKLRSGDLLLLYGLVTSVELYQVYEFEFGEPVNFIGFPSYGGSGQMLAACGTTVAMHAASGHKEGVWEFIKFNLSRERQESLEATSGSGFPVLESALEDMLREEMEEEYYTDADGEEKKKPKSFWAVGGTDVEVYAATEEQVGRIRELIDGVQPKQEMDDALLEIIYGEAEAYFSGQKEAGDVAETVQNRVQVYLGER